MKNLFIGLLLGLLLGAAAGFAAGIFAYPFVFLNDIVASEFLPESERGEIFARGEFIHANSSDPVHYGSGHVTVYENTVYLQEDFEVGPGPAYHVYLVPTTEVTPETPVAELDYLDLGRLHAFKGSQVYRLPSGTELREYGSVVIWCEQFGVLISPAALNFR